MKQLISGLYAFVIAVILIAIGYSSSHLFEIAGDSLRYSFGETGWEYAKFNYFKGTGRWAQGLTNDYRLYTIRGTMAALSTGVFLYGAFVFLSFS